MIWGASVAGKAGDADFTTDNAPGITVIAPNNIPNWDAPALGDSPADNVIEKVLQSIRYGGSVQVELANIVPGNTYKLQLLFYEQCCGNRGFNVYVDGQLLAADFSPPEIQGGVNLTSAGAVISAEITTQRHSMVILATIQGRTREDLTDPNAILDGVTLEVIKGDLPPSNPPLKFSKDQGKVVLTYEGNLQSADAVGGPYTDVTGATSPATIPTSGAQKYFRARR